MPREVNAPETIGQRMTQEQFAASGYRALTYASQQEPLAWGMLTDVERQSWLRVAAQADAILNENDGKTYAEVVAPLLKVYVGPRPSWVVELPEAVAWEAVVRHLTQLLDDDEIGDLSALEQSWREWATKRLHELEKRP